MAMALRPAASRGHYKNHWLDSSHTFSFGEYHDPAHMGYSDLRVLNQDIVQGGGGFPLHRHRDMEIVSWILQGHLRHEDSMGHVAVSGPGGLQRLSAGSGMAHGEFNDSDSEPVQFLQIWLPPRRAGAEPSYETKQFDAAALASSFVLVAGPEGRAGAARIDQDARLFATRLAAGEKRILALPAGRRAWVHVGLGSCSLKGKALIQGDGAALEGETSLEFTGIQSAEILVFDLR
jgi:redox-sensitive bicupin YhaK (pirin superfamily)